MSVSGPGSTPIRPDPEAAGTTPEGDALLAELEQARGSGSSWLSFLDGASGLRPFARALAEDGILDAQDVKKLVIEAKDFGGLTRAEKAALRGVLRDYERKLAPEAREALARFLGVSLSRPAQPTAPAAPTGPAAPAGPGAPPAANAALDRANARLPEIGGKRYEIGPDGFPRAARSPGGPVRNDAAGAELVYRAGNALVEAPRGVLRGIGAETQRAIVSNMTALYDAALEDFRRSPVMNTSAEKMRSGAAAHLLAVIEGADSPAVMNEAAAAYLDRALGEPNEALRASMYRNIAGLKGSLSAQNAAKVAELQKRVIPQAPPYAEWFDPQKNPTGTLELRHYAHDDCWKYGENPVDGYKRMGLEVVREGRSERGEQFWELRGTVKDPTGRNPDLPVHIKLYKTHDEILRDMDDPKVHAVFYTGHSNLGGNVSEAIKSGPEANGTKFVQLQLCRGQQNIFEVANKYPNAHLSTSRDPHYFHNVMTVATNTLLGFAAREDYAAIDRRSDIESNNFIRPHEETRYQYVDQDRDGKMELDPTGGDRFFDVVKREPDTSVADLRPRAETRPARDIDGEKVVDGVNFARTLITYHNDHGIPRGSPLAGIEGDRFVAAGWFDAGPNDPPVRISEERGADGKPVYKVSVNKSLSGQGTYALGALVQYEIFRHFAEKDGRFTPKEKARALIATGEYLSYMYCTNAEAEAIMRAVGERAGVRNLRFSTVFQAIEADDHGYITDGQVRALMERVQIR